MEGIVVWADEYDEAKKIIEYDTHFLVIGGDGTLLRAISLFWQDDKPFYPVAGGTVNFLMNENEAEDFKTLQPLEWNMLRVEVNGQTYMACNEVAIGSFCGWVEFSSDSHKFPKFNGSSLIVSTAQGSTGLNRNSGGTILPIDSKNWSIVSTQSPTRVDTVLKPDETTISIKSRKLVNIVIDNANKLQVKEADIVLSKGKTVTVVYNDINKFKEKRWGML